MDTSSSPHVLRPGTGRALKLGAPMAGEVTFSSDPRHAGGQFTVAIQTLQPGSSLPTHRYLFLDRMLFIHKGQGRITVGNQSMTVVPGALVTVPHQTWLSLRNNGTGVLEVAWTCAPAGIDAFFQELATQTQLDLATLQAVGHRYGVEFGTGDHAAPEAAAQSVRPHRRRRGGRNRGRGHGQSPSPATQAQAAKAAGAEPTTPLSGSTQTSPQPASGQPPPRGRRHRRHRGRPQQPGANLTIHTEPDQTPSKGERVREVYMGGRWVKVTGDGPVVYPGKQYFRDRKRPKDDDTPSGPLSVIP